MHLNPKVGVLLHRRDRYSRREWIKHGLTIAATLGGSEAAFGQ